MYSRIFALILAVGMGIGIGALTVARLASDDPSRTALPKQDVGSLAEQLTRGESSELNPEQLAQVLESLIQILDNEISERRVLAEQLDELRTEMTELRQNLRVRVEEAFAAEAGSTASQTPEARANQTVETRLAAAGFTPWQIEAMRRSEAGAQMRQIEFDDRARREGWVNTPRYYDEYNKLTSATDSIRSDLGDEAYDRYLFASGRPNRIAVSTIIETSPAERAGFKPGDVIKSYGGERVFSGQQLTKLRSTGEKGAPVTIEIIRNGELMQITMPRGPMGVQIGLDTVDPSTPDGG